MRIASCVTFLLLMAGPVTAQTAYSVTARSGEPIRMYVTAAQVGPSRGATFQASQVSWSADSAVITLPAQLALPDEAVDLVLRAATPTDTLVLEFTRLDAIGSQTVRAVGSEIHLQRLTGQGQPEIRADRIDVSRP